MKTQTQRPIIALIGNPNSGKTSVFNRLTGLRQKVANFPGVTVDKKYGPVVFDDSEAVLLDLPGTYSLYPTAEDERIVLEHLLGTPEHPVPDAVVYVADTTQFEKHLLLFTQIKDLGIPIMLVCNMQDEADKRTITLDLPQLERKLGVPVVSVSARTGLGFDRLKTEAARLLTHSGDGVNEPIFKMTGREEWMEAVRAIVPGRGGYQSWLLAHHFSWFPGLSETQRGDMAEALGKAGFVSLKEEVFEITERFHYIEPLARDTVTRKTAGAHPLTEKLDRWFTGKYTGPLIFAGILLLVFQAIFSWASYPMDLIDATFSGMANAVKSQWPEHWMSALLADGIIAGLGGIFIFVPQIAILFFLIAILEETGYMARAVYLFDGLMQRFGLNGRSVVALVSGGACAIPAIMSTRTISNAKERLITILVTPFISCSARIPIYAIFVAFLVPPTTVLGFFNLQGLVFGALYVAGVLAALISAYILHRLMKKSSAASFLMMELPDYRIPVWRNVLTTSYEKVKTFVVEAGKIILGISIVLWLLASYGPQQSMQMAESEALAEAQSRGLNEEETEHLLASKQLESSYAGILGKTIEPVIRPLGYDWKIGIALITSFAAREVFISTVSTIYAIGSESEDATIKSRLRAEINPDTGKPRYDFATTLSLLAFYIFAMQCMSTLAIVRRETGTWKWPLIQFTAMTAIAYLAALFCYQIFS